MSETITPEPESQYPTLSEATENDVREEPAVAVEEAPPEPAEAAPAAEEAAPAQEEDPDELKARTARLARELREQKRRARDLELETQALRGQRQAEPNEQIEREVAQRAAQMATQQRLNERANDIYAQGVKAYGRVEFDESVKAMNETFGMAMPLVIDTLVDVDNPQRLIQHLADNPDIADNLALLPAHKLSAALARTAAKLDQPKAVSKAPPPIRPISTTSSAEPEDIEKMSMEQLAKLWDARDAKKRMGM